MTESILVALITGGLALIGVVYSSREQGRKADARVQTALAVAEAKLVELTREVREHNNFAQRMPVVEEQIKVINNRVKDLEARS